MNISHFYLRWLVTEVAVGCGCILVYLKCLRLVGICACWSDIQYWHNMIHCLRSNVVGWNYLGSKYVHIF